MSTLKVRLANYFQPDPSPRMIKPEDIQQLLEGMRGLIGPFLDNAAFFEGVLDLSFIRHLPICTIFSRNERGKTSYLLTELGNDMRNDVIDPKTIDRPTENAIRALAKLVAT